MAYILAPSILAADFTKSGAGDEADRRRAALPGICTLT